MTVTIDQKSATFELDISGRGDGRVVVNGQEVQRHVTGLTYEAVPGHIPRLHLQLRGDTVLHGDGIVYVSAPSPGDGVLEFIESLSPGKIEELMLEDDGLGTSMGDTIIKVLRRLAGGE